MSKHWIKLVTGLMLGLVAGGMLMGQSTPQPASAEAKAIAFLQREVPAWKRNNGCFSCHNNGDAVRALYAATQKGYRLPAEVLADTNAWLSEPLHWDNNKGDPGFSDKKLANLQFAAALVAGLEAGQSNSVEPLQQAARKLLSDQSADGSWKIDEGNLVGSPATWGAALATWMGVQTLRKANLAEAQNAQQKAERWLQQRKPHNVPTAAILLFALPRDAAPSRQEALQFLQRAQTRDGGWGPYADAPPECFDTALALLALAPLRTQTDIVATIRRGRDFLIAQQNADGSWPATTRPSGGDSYAQMMSTTGWVTLALLETKE